MEMPPHTMKLPPPRADTLSMQQLGNPQTTLVNKVFWYFPRDLTSFWVSLFTHQLHDNYKWDMLEREMNKISTETNFYSNTDQTQSSKSFLDRFIFKINSVYESWQRKNFAL